MTESTKKKINRKRKADSDVESLKESFNPQEKVFQYPAKALQMMSQFSEEQLVQMMLSKLHQTIFEHLKGMNMNRTAEHFLEESKYFPSFQADVKEIPKDVLNRCVDLLKENLQK